MGWVVLWMGHASKNPVDIGWAGAGPGHFQLAFSILNTKNIDVFRAPGLGKQGCKVLFEGLQGRQSPCSHAPVDLQCFSGDAHAIPTVLGGRKRDLCPLAMHGIANGQFELARRCACRKLQKNSYGLMKQLEEVGPFWNHLHGGLWDSQYFKMGGTPSPLVSCSPIGKSMRRWLTNCCSCCPTKLLAWHCQHGALAVTWAAPFQCQAPFPFYFDSSLVGLLELFVFFQPLLQIPAQTKCSNAMLKDAQPQGRAKPEGASTQRAWEWGAGVAGCGRFCFSPSCHSRAPATWQRVRQGQAQSGKGRWHSLGWGERFSLALQWKPWPTHQ